ncbi:MAG: GNAT family N-acetyltransferase [Chloroflexota bacterium]|nr:GNAT family N-acetyltransferase [Chloroflexota bacterium]
MEFIRYTAFESLAEYKNQWNHLLKFCASHVPFLTFEYQQAWWKTHGGGEWPEDSELVLVAAFQEQHLTGVAPLFQTKNAQGKLALLFVGAVEVSDFLDFIVHPKDLPVFVTGLLDFLMNAPGIPPWETLDLYNLLEDTPTIKVLKTEAEWRGWTFTQVHLQPAPFIPLQGDYQAYLAGISKKQRHEIRRKVRNVEISLAEGRLYFTQDAHHLESDINAFIDMMAQDPTKHEFLTNEMRWHLRITAQTAFDHNWLQLAFLTLDGNKAAANMSFVCNNRLWLYNSGWDWNYRDLSPGWVLLAYLIQWATETGIEEFDFMRGDEPYKYKFGGIDRQVYRVIVTP